MSAFTLVVDSGPDSQGAFSAWQFAQAAIRQGHQIKQVFFYRQGVYNTTALLSPPSEETNLMHHWQQLYREHQVELVCCVAAALRRGIVDQHSADEQGLAQHNLAEGFRLGGLGELVTALPTTDRLVQF